MKKILVVQGANLIHLGKREPQHYGTTPREEYDRVIQEHAQKNGYDVEILYTNTEGEAIDKIYQAEASGVEGLLMNPGGFSYGGYALRDCIKAVRLPYVEVHISHMEQRGLKSVVADASDGVISGLGLYGYLLGLDALFHIIQKKRA